MPARASDNPALRSTPRQASPRRSDTPRHLATIPTDATCHARSIRPLPFQRDGTVPTGPVPKRRPTPPRLTPERRADPTPPAATCRLNPGVAAPCRCDKPAPPSPIRPHLPTDRRRGQCVGGAVRWPAMVASPRSSAYHRMSIAGKQAAAREQLAEPPVTCPADCGVRLMPSDLPLHLAERCPGAGEPGPAARWIPLSEARAIAPGVPRSTLTFWARNGYVRTRGGRGDRQYLLRDLVRRAGIRALDRRR